jgi:hypothetical protein
MSLSESTLRAQYYLVIDLKAIALESSSGVSKKIFKMLFNEYCGGW